MHDGELQCLECCTCDIHSLLSGLVYSAVGYGKCDQQLVSQWSVTVEWSGIIIIIISSMPLLERSCFHEVLPTSSILGVSPRRVQAKVVRLEIRFQHT